MRVLRAFLKVVGRRAVRVVRKKKSWAGRPRGRAIERSAAGARDVEKRSGR